MDCFQAFLQMLLGPEWGSREQELQEVRLLQGSADIDVPPSVALKLFEHAESPDMRLTLVKGADHRFSEPENLALISRTLDELPL